VQCLFQLVLWKKHFLWCWYCHRKQIKMWFSVVHTLIDKEYASLLFSQTFFSFCFCMLNKFAKVFERKVWRVQVAHLHQRVGVFNCQLSTNLDKDFFRYLWYCGKKQIECGLAWSVLLSITSTRHHMYSGKSLLWTHSAVPFGSTTFWPLRWCVLIVDKSTDHAIPHSIC